MRNEIGVYAVKPLRGKDLVVGTAHLSRCRLDRDVLVIELAALPVDGCLYLPLHDVLTLHREQVTAALPSPASIDPAETTVPNGEALPLMAMGGAL